MHYFDTARRRVNDLPCFAWGQPICEPSLRPLEAGGYEISLMFGTGVAYWHSCKVASDEELLQWLSAWKHSPEGVIQQFWPEFNPAPEPRAQPSRNSGKHTLSLDDIR